MARLHAAHRRFGRSDDAAPADGPDAAFAESDPAGARRGASLELARRSYSQPPDTIADAWEPPGQVPGGFLFGGGSMGLRSESSCAGDDGGGGIALAGLAGIALLHDPDPCAGRIAQLVEQLTLNQRVPGSSPGAPTT